MDGSGKNAPLHETWLSSVGKAAWGFLFIVSGLVHCEFEERRFDALTKGFVGEVKMEEDMHDNSTSIHREEKIEKDMHEKIEEVMHDNFTSIHPCHCTGTSLSCLAKEDNGAAATIKKPAKKYRTRETQTNDHNGAAATIEKPAKKYRTRETQTNNHNGDSPANIRHWLYLHKVAIVAYLVFLLLFLFRFHTLAVYPTFLFSVFSTTCRSWPTLIVGWDFLLPKNLHVFVKFCVANCVFTRAYLLLALDAIPRMEWNKVSFEFMIVILLFLVEHLEMIRRYKNRLHELSNREPKAPSGKDPSAGGLLLPDKPAASPSAQRSTQSAATT